MNSRRQRSRMPNFTVGEENVLRELTAKYQRQIEEKTSNAHVWRAKNRAWENIAIEFYNNTQIQRSAVKLKSKYETMKKLNKVPNMSVKKEQTLIDNTKLGQSCEVGELKVDLDIVEQAKLLDHIKAEIHGNGLMCVEELDLSDVDQTMSVLDDGSYDADTVMSENVKSPIFLAEVKPNNNPEIESKPPTEKDVKDMREFLQQYTNYNQSDEQIYADSNNISYRQAGAGPLHCSDEEDNGLVKDLAKQILRRKLFKSSFKQPRELSLTHKSLAAQFNYYRNMDIRAQQKHLAELKNLEIQRKILELDLKMKQKEFDKN